LSSSVPDVRAGVTRFQVYADGHPAVELYAHNWITALGMGVEMMEDAGGVEGLGQLACEVLPNGTVIARDSSTGRHFVVRSLDDQPSAHNATVPVWAPVEDMPQFALPADDDESAEAGLPGAPAPILITTSAPALRPWVALVFALATVVGAALASLAAYAGT
jgi:hypothetical protein